MRIFKSHPLLKLVNSYLIDSSQPSNISYLWNFGSLLAFCLIIQIVTGVTLAMHYSPNVLEAFNSVEHIMRDVNNGWLIRYLHANTASAFFFIVYLHISRGLYYGSYKAPRTLVWTIGTVIFILMMATAFLGYVLPFGQMSLWGATVITNLMSAIPWVGQDIVEFIWGGFSVNNATLNRFYALHFVLPFILAALALMHLIALHDSAGSGNPIGTSGNYDRLSFAPYYLFKDLITIFLFALVLSLFVFFMPNLLGDSENYVMANPMQTPPAIVPEWYLLPFYAILRSIPDKLLGVIAMFSAILILLAMPFTDLSRSRGIQFRPLSKIAFFIFIGNFLILLQLGAKHVESPFIELGQISTVIYFAYFLIVMPLITLFENTIQEFTGIGKVSKVGAYDSPTLWASFPGRGSLGSHREDYCVRCGYWCHCIFGARQSQYLDLPSTSSEKPKAKKPEAEKPEAKKPEAKKPEAKKPKGKKPEGKKPVPSDTDTDTDTLVPSDAESDSTLVPSDSKNKKTISNIVNYILITIISATLSIIVVYILIKTATLDLAKLNPSIFCDAPRPWGIYFQDSATPQMEGLVELHDNILFYLVIILFSVGWILWSVVRTFTNNKSAVTLKYVSHGTLIELIWTISPALILIAIAFPSFKLLYLMDEVTDSAMAVLAEGHQWYWSYQYPDFFGTDTEFLEFDSYLVPESDLEDGALRMLEVDNRVILPETTHVRLIVTGADVIHSYACPSLGLKCDAYPGRLNQASLLINREGTFYGQCSEICGILHSSMPIVVESVSFEKFVAWVKQQ